MRFSLFFTLLALAWTAYGWDKYDHEIFDLVSELEAAEGKGTTFYSYLDVPSTATTSEIAKAYRKKSMMLHPDKNPGVKGIHEIFSRLGKISTILRSEETREKYDFFYKNGVPKWRGTGYYYSRFRPGLGSVLTFLIILSSGMQYLIQKINYKSDLARIELCISKARQAAWGPKLNRIESKRKVKVNIGGSTYVTEDGEEFMSGGKWLEMVVEGDQVYILEPDGELLPLDRSAATPPAIKRTWFLALIGSIYRRWFPQSHPSSEEELRTELEDTDETDEPSDQPKRGESNGNALQGRAAASKQGGRRRKGGNKSR